jgi:patatin-like phospholipase/acyl hydrolase
MFIHIVLQIQSFSSTQALMYTDGGGMSGISTLYILRELFSQLNAKRENSGRPMVKPCEVFDLIGGTGVGG